MSGVGFYVGVVHLPLGRKIPGLTTARSGLHASQKRWIISEGHQRPVLHSNPLAGLLAIGSGHNEPGSSD